MSTALSPNSFSHLRKSLCIAALGALLPLVLARLIATAGGNVPVSLILQLAACLGLICIAVRLPINTHRALTAVVVLGALGFAAPAMGPRGSLTASAFITFAVFLAAPYVARVLFDVIFARRYRFDHNVFFRIDVSSWATTTLRLEAGEKMIVDGPVSPWMVGFRAHPSGPAQAKGYHDILLQAPSDQSHAQIVLRTNRREYFLVLVRNDDDYASRVEWRYPPPLPPSRSLLS